MDKDTDRTREGLTFKQARAALAKVGVVLVAGADDYKVRHKAQPKSEGAFDDDLDSAYHTGLFIASQPAPTPNPWINLDSHKD